MDLPYEPELVIHGGEPIVLQVEEQIRRQILHGILRPGEELPTVRAIAVGLAVNPHTVEQAYEQLQQEGFLTSGDGSGPRVAGSPARANNDELDNHCRDFLRRMAAEGYSLAEVLQVLHAGFDRSNGHGKTH